MKRHKQSSNHNEMGTTHVCFGTYLTSADSKISEVWSLTIKDPPAISTFIKERRTQLAGHCHGATTEPFGVHSVLFRQPRHGKNSVGGQHKRFVDTDRLTSDTGLVNENSNEQ